MQRIEINKFTKVLTVQYIYPGFNKNKCQQTLNCISWKIYGKVGKYSTCLSAIFEHTPVGAETYM